MDPVEWESLNGPDRRAVYIISVAAELAGVHPQTLRIYERKGLVRPHRTSGNTRRYSEADIDRLRHIQRLTQEGVNLAGAKRIMALEEELHRVRARIAQLEARLEDHAIPMPGERAGVAILPLSSVFSPPWLRRRV
ncbi:MAG: heat shock protein transcriptional repressor HspR [Actinomycetota bacterium]